MGLFRTRCAPPAGTKIPCDEVGFNAAISYPAAGDERAAKDVLAQMKDPKNKLDANPLTTKLACRLNGGPKSVCR